MRQALWAIVIILFVAWLLGLILDIWWPNINVLLALAVVVALYTTLSSRKNLET